MPSTSPFTDLRQRLTQMPPINPPPPLEHSPRQFRNLASTTSSSQQQPRGSSPRATGRQRDAAQPEDSSSRSPPFPAQQMMLRDHPLNPMNPPPPLPLPSQTQIFRNSRQRNAVGAASSRPAHSSSLPPPIPDSRRDPHHFLNNSVPHSMHVRSPQHDIMSPRDLLPDTSALPHNRRSRMQQQQQQQQQQNQEGRRSFGRRRRSSRSNNSNTEEQYDHAYNATDQTSSVSGNGNGSGINPRTAFAHNPLVRSGRWLLNGGGAGGAGNANNRDPTNHANINSIPSQFTKSMPSPTTNCTTAYTTSIHHSHGNIHGNGIDMLESSTSTSTDSRSPSANHDDVNNNSNSSSIKNEDDDDEEDEDTKTFATPQPLEQSFRDDVAIQFRDFIEQQNSPIRREDYLDCREYPSPNPSSSPNHNHSRNNDVSPRSSPRSNQSPVSPQRVQFHHSMSNDGFGGAMGNSNNYTLPLETGRHEYGMERQHDSEDNAYYSSSGRQGQNYTISNQQYPGHDGNYRHNDFAYNYNSNPYNQHQHPQYQYQQRPQSFPSSSRINRNKPNQNRRVQSFPSPSSSNSTMPNNNQNRSTRSHSYRHHPISHHHSPDDASWIGDVLHAAQMAGKNDIMNGNKVTTEDVFHELHQMTGCSINDYDRHNIMRSHQRQQEQQQKNDRLSDDQSWMMDALQSKDSDPAEVIRLLRQFPRSSTVNHQSMASDEKTVASWWHDVLNVKDDVSQDVLRELQAFVRKKSFSSCSCSTSGSDSSSSGSSSSDNSSSSSSSDSRRRRRRRKSRKRKSDKPKRQQQYQQSELRSSNIRQMATDARGPVPTDDILGCHFLRSLSRDQEDGGGNSSTSYLQGEFISQSQHGTSNNNNNNGNASSQESEEMRRMREDLLEQAGPDGVIPKEVLQALCLPENFLDGNPGSNSNKSNSNDGVTGESKQDDSNQRDSVDTNTRERRRKLQNLHRRQSQHAKYTEKKTSNVSDEASWLEDVRSTRKIGRVPSDILKALGVSESTIDLGSDSHTVVSGGTAKTGVEQDQHGPIPNDELVESLSLFSGAGGEGSTGSKSGADARSHVEQDARGPIPDSDFVQSGLSLSSDSKGGDIPSSTDGITGSKGEGYDSEGEDQSEELPSQMLAPEIKIRQEPPQSNSSMRPPAATNNFVGIEQTKPSLGFLSRSNFLEDAYPRTHPAHADDTLAQAMKMRLEVLESMKRKSGARN